MKKVILITGASSGMGKDATIRLAKAGYTVYGAARRVEQMKELEAEGGHAIKLDVTDVDNIKSVVDRVVSEQKRIDVLWNNAGYSCMGTVEDVTLEDAKHQMEVNLFGVSEMTKAALPYMREQKSGLIINTSSVGGKIFSPLNAWYHASKHALEGLSDSLRIELRPFNIDVVILQPGGVKSEFGKVAIGPLSERSKGSAYADLYKKLIKAYQSQFGAQTENMSEPSVISDTIVKIINSKDPKTRYPAASMARIILLLRRMLSDRGFERLIVSQLDR